MKTRRNGLRHAADSSPLLLDPPQMRRLDSEAGTRFIDIEVDGKVGHLNAETLAGIEEAFTAPNLETIYELKNGVAVWNPKDRFTPISLRARQPMSEEMRRAALLRCNVEMRSYHRSADNPIDRHDKWSALSGVVDAVNYGLRCALVLDGQPYPYVKWLYVAASISPTGRAVVAHVDRIVDLLQSDPSALLGPEKENEISTILRRIRAVIVDRAKATGIDEPWLRQWWLHFRDSDAAFDGVEWGM